MKADHGHFLGRHTHREIIQTTPVEVWKTTFRKREIFEHFQDMREIARESITWRTPTERRTTSISSEFTTGCRRCKKAISRVDGTIHTMFIPDNSQKKCQQRLARPCTRHCTFLQLKPLL